MPDHSDIVIGSSTEEQAYYRAYWDNLLQLKKQSSDHAKPNSNQPSQTTRPVWEYGALAKNLRVRDLQLTDFDRRHRLWIHKTVGRLVPIRRPWPFAPFPIVAHRRVRSVTVGEAESLRGSRMLLSGTLTNGNAFPLKVLAVNYKVLDPFGNLLQTGAVTPDPSTIGPRQTVTLQDLLFAIPLHDSYEVKLMTPAFVLGH
jgi:hypothetical protein